jgi:methylenetetrahydrofolate dehydrogenase (NADP+) / methenyltetrahydrofolate cyclohydrolase
MPAQILNGKELAEKILLQVKAKVASIDHKPGLAAILVGDNEASKIYLKLKEKACKEADILFSNYIISQDCNEAKILEVINFLNNDPETTGIIVQLPLPEKFDTNKIIQAIDPKKDIDGFHKNSKFISPNALGIVELLKETKVSLKDKNIIILSNSEEFSQPFKKLLPDSILKHYNLKSKTLNKDLPQADIIIIAVGIPNYLKPQAIKKDAILIDVGITKVDGKTIGDIDPTCDKVASWRSPVPGGVGPMTVAMLLQNLVNLVK